MLDGWHVRPWRFEIPATIVPFSFRTARTNLLSKHFTTYPMSGANEAGAFLLDVACCSSSNTLNKLSPKGSAMIFTFAFPQYNTRLSLAVTTSGTVAVRFKIHITHPT